MTNWDDWEKLMFHGLYNELKVAPEEHAIIYALNPKLSQAEKEKILQIFAETFNISALFLISGAALTLYNVGIKTGLAVMCGERGTFVVPVYEGYELQQYIQSNDIGGKYVTTILKTMINNLKGLNILDDQAENIKKEHCFVSSNFQSDLADPAKHNVVIKLVDDQDYNLNRERFVAPEILFNPSVVQNPSIGIAQLIKKVLDSCDPDLKRLFETNIVLSGGCTELPGFLKRLQEETQYQYGFITEPNKKNGVFYGSQKFFTTEKYNLVDISISRSEYDLWGPTLVKYYMI